MTFYALSVAQLARRAGLPVETVRTLQKRGQLPEPDVIVGADTMRPARGWTPETVDAWLTGRKAR